MFLKVIQTQGILFFRNRAFYIYLVLLVAITVGVLLLESIGELGIGTSVTLVNTILFFQFPMLALLIAPLVERSRKQDWMWATSTEELTLAFAQLISITIILSSLLSILFFCIFGVSTLLGGLPIIQHMNLFVHGLIAILIVTILQISVVLAISILIPHTLAVTLIIILVDAFLGLSLYQPTETLLSIQNFPLRSWHVDSVAGIAAEQAILYALLVFYASLSPLILLITISLYKFLDQRADWYHGRLTLCIALIVCSIITSFAWRNYFRAVNIITVPEPVAVQIETWKVLTAIQEATIQNELLSVNVEMILQNDSSEIQSFIELDINTGFNFTKAMVNNHLVQVKRIGEMVRLTDLNTNIAPRANIQLSLNYSGQPILLREDYRTIEDLMLSDSPPIYQRMYTSYLDNNVLHWSRDSNWLAWPFTSSAHVAKNEHQLVIKLDYPSSSIVTSGNIIDEHSGTTTLEWTEIPPQLLIAAGTYIVHQFISDQVWIGRFSKSTSINDEQKSFLNLYKHLDAWLEPSDDIDRYTVIELPYTNIIEIGDSAIGIPSDNNNLGNAGTELERQLDQAIRMSRAWLKAQVSWPSFPLTTEGEAQYRLVDSSTCNPESYHCIVENLGGSNPQAPHGRLVEDAVPTVILQAFSITMAYYLIDLSSEGNKLLIEEQKDEWTQIGEIFLPENNQSYSSAGFELADFPSSDRRLLGSYEDHNNCELATFVLALLHYSEQFGPDTFKDWIEQLRQTHPLGTQPITEKEIWGVGEKLANDSWLAPIPQCYSDYNQ